MAYVFPLIVMVAELPAGIDPLMVGVSSLVRLSPWVVATAPLATAAVPPVLVLLSATTIAAALAPAKPQTPTDALLNRLVSYYS